MHFSEPLTNDDRQTICNEISASSMPRPSFYTMLLFATIIAAYGLLTNSTSVVIGAMLVAPLMTPIIGSALSLVISDQQTLRNSSVAELSGVALTLCIGIFIGTVTFNVELSEEILSRTHPSPYDVIIALAAGFAGAYSTVNSRFNANLAGVAIATSLVPPLTASGLCLSQGEYPLALGAFLLFFSNFLAIQLAGAITFLWHGFASVHIVRNRLLISRLSISLILLIAVSVYLTYGMIRLLDEQNIQKQLEQIVREEVQQRMGARLTSLSFEKEDDGGKRVMAIVMTPQEFLANEVAKIEQLIQTKVKNNVHLVIRSVLSKDTSAQGQVFLSDAEFEKLLTKQQSALFLEKATHLLNGQFQQIAGAKVVEIRREDSADVKNIVASVRTPTAIPPEQVAKLQALLQDGLDKNTRLIVRSILTKDADAQHFLYETQPLAKEELVEKPLSGEELAFHQTVAATLRELLPKTIIGSSLLEFTYRKDDNIADLTRLLITVRTPLNYSSANVQLLQKGLQAATGVNLKVVVRSVVGIDTDEKGYLADQQKVDNIATVPVRN